MKYPWKTGLATLVCLAMPVFAEDYSTALSEDALRSLVPFGADATLKLAECETKSYPTCTYIWGIPDIDDAARVALGGMPDGDKLITIFAQASRPQDFDRVIASYRDAVPVEGLGVTAVWSGMRGQLSLITADNLVVHVNVQRAGLDDPLTSARQIASVLLAGM